MMDKLQQTIRRAVSADGPVLTRMVRESAAYTGEYQRMVENIVISAELIARDLVSVCEHEGRIVGFYSLIARHDDAELDFMFVENGAQGSGIGRLLFQHMLAEARQLGYAEVKIISHPPAERFYQRMGAMTVAVKPPSGRVTWSRPSMLVRTEQS
jgi:N-acetylglutamate synthase-like GNAT family acetyltransferase